MVGKFDDLPYKQLQKKHAAHLKDKKQRPDDDKFKSKDDKIKEDINGYKLRLAELKWQHDQIRAKTDKLRDDQQAKNQVLQQAQEQLQERKRQTKSVNQELVTKMGFTENGMPKRIKDPKGTLAAYKAEYQNEKNRLRSEALSMAEERKANRQLRILEQNIKHVETYMENNVDEVFQQKDLQKKNMDEFRKTHQEAYEDFQEARQKANVEFDNLGSNKKEQEKIQEKIKKLQDQRQQTQSDYQTAMDSWNQWQRTERALKTAMNNKQYDEEEVEASTRSEPKRKKTEAKEAKKEVAAEEEKRKKAQEQVQSVEERRKAAIEAFNRCQDKLKNKSASAGEVAEVAQVADKKQDDPHEAEKELCRSLIAYCRSNMPEEKKDSPSKGKKKKRKRKKKIRLTHKASNFSNFAKVGVGIPIWSTDLESCIKHLEERISSYDTSDAEKEVTDTPV